MEEIEKYSENELQALSYRVLQQIAKSMSLPSNVKKVYLVQLIYAKTHKTSVEVKAIVNKVKHERWLLSQNNNNKRKGKKKMSLQAMEVSSSNTCTSPIDLTRAYSPEMPNFRPVTKYYPRVFSPKNTSDRVLRSYNLKSYKRPNYSLLNNSIMELVKASERNSPKKETQISIVSHEGKLPKLNVTARCVVKKYRPILYSPRSYLRAENQVASASVTTQTQNTSSALVPAKRGRTISGISPIRSPEKPLKTNYIKSIGFRRTDGKISKINALVQKPAPVYNFLDFEPPSTSYKNVEVTIQDIINSNIDSQTFTNPKVSEYMLTGSNMASYQMPLSDVMPNQKIVQGANNAFSVYYHKKIRAEQVRTKRNSSPVPVVRKVPNLSVARNVANEHCLPTINDVLSKMNADAAHDVTRPIYINMDQTKNKVSVARIVANSQRLPTINDAFSKISSDAAREVARPIYVNVHDQVSVARSFANELRLPTIKDAFSKMSADAARDVTRPIYVNVQDPTNNDVSVASNVANVSVARNIANEQRLPTISDACSKMSAEVTRPIYTNVHDQTNNDVSVARNVANEQRLPTISVAFSKMSAEAARDVTRPIYVNVLDQTNEAHNYPHCRSNPMLESLYNLKNESLAQPLVQIATTTTTRCVYSTPTISTARQSPAAPAHPSSQVSSFEPDSQYSTNKGTSDEVSRLCDLSSFGEQDMTLRRYYHEAMSSSSLESQEDASVNMVEMVEDALELISQDGDYMERIGMDVRMQCILCSWAGSKIVLEYHIREEHLTQITQQDKSEWNVTYKLGSLVNQPQWLSHVCERDGTLFIISAKYEDPDCFMVSLSTLTSFAASESRLGTITLYNNVTGEPYSWHGPIPQLPSNMPYENDPNCLKIELSKLELLPNSANLKLLNRTLVLNSSPSNVVVGQPELNDIHIIIFVNVHNV